MTASKTRTAKKAETAVIEIIAIEIVERHRCTRRAHERIELLVLEEHGHAHARELVTIVPAHRTLLGDRIVRLADFRMEQKRDVAEHVS